MKYDFSWWLIPQFWLRNMKITIVNKLVHMMCGSFCIIYCNKKEKEESSAKWGWLLWDLATNELYVGLVTTIK